MSSEAKSKLELRLCVTVGDSLSVSESVTEVEDPSELELDAISGLEKAFGRDIVGLAGGVEGGSTICSGAFCSTSVGGSECVVVPVDIDELDVEGISISSSRS